MSSLSIIDENKKQVGEVSLDEALMKEPINKAVLYYGLRHYNASKRHGTVRTKTRAEVNRTGKKLYRQKGTGGARHGSRKTAPFVGGGRVFGPKPRDFAYSLPRKVGQLAMREALRSRMVDNQVVVMKTFSLKEKTTSDAKKFFDGVNVQGGLVVLDKDTAPIKKAVRNLKNFKVVDVNQLTIFDLLKFAPVVFTASSFEAVKARFLAN